MEVTFIRTITSIILIAIAVLLTSIFWYVVITNHNELNPNFGNPVTGPTPTPFGGTPKPTANPTLAPNPTPTPTPTLQPTTGTTNPTAPQFTLSYVDRSYDVPPTYKTDPYTGKQIIDNAGYHQDNRTIDVTITNPTFSPSTLADGNVTALYYNVRTKGHFEDWTNDQAYNHGVQTVKYSPSGTTVISFYIGGWNIGPGGQVDFQVQAIVGYEHNDPSQCFGYHFYTLGKSDWSDTQTITIPGAAATATSTP